MPDYDLIVRNGRIVDGSGGPPYVGDLAITGDRIAAVGDIAGAAREEIDAGGMAVAPGFIDVHAHDDAAVVRDPSVDFKIMQGVTTDVVGNCGAGVAPANANFREAYARNFSAILGESDLPWTTVAEYFDAVDAAHPACNVAAYIPHGVVRFNVMGGDKREPTPAELDEMRALVDEAMRAGAIGLSTGLIYPPGTYAKTDELVELAKVSAKYGGIYTSHIRNESEGLLEAMAEAIEVGERSGCGVQLSHHKAGGPGVYGLTKTSLQVMADVRARGIDVTTDAYPYVASSSSLAAMWRIGRERVFEAVPAIVASVKYHKEKYEGRYISDIAADLDLTIGDTVRKVLEDEENTPSVIMFIMDEGDVRRVVADDHCMIGSDGLPSEGKPHPRLYGTMARALQVYVREEGLVSLEEEVRKMTSFAAQKHRIRDRGLLRAGAFADVVVFDPDTIEDIATYTEPRQYPRGIAHVVVNGELAVRDGRQTAARLGRMLRHRVA